MNALLASASVLPTPSASDSATNSRPAGKVSGFTPAEVPGRSGHKTALPSFPLSHLRPEHIRMLEGSAIAPALMTPERYESVSNAARLRALGFSQEQCFTVPGLLIHYRNAQGETFHQFRPDKPRKDRPKYETPPGKPGKYGLDIPESMRERVLHSLEELWFTEGGKKSDAGASADVCMVSLPGVYMFNWDGKPLRDFDIIPLKGRVVVIAYDSDAMTKASVYEAVRRLAALLRKRGAIVRFCYLPDDGEIKVGLDDYLAAGHTLEELRSLVEDKLRPVSTGPVTALIRTLNKQSQGAGTFFPKRLDITEEANDIQLLSLLRTINNEKQKIEEEFRFWMGDAYNRLNLPHGSKLETLDAAIGEGNRRQIGKWGSVCNAFSGERNYFRYAAPWWFLAEIAGMSEAEQDDMLRRYVEGEANAAEALTREEAKEMRLTRDKVRALKFSAAENLDTKKDSAIDWKTLEMFLPDEFLSAYREAVAIGSTVEANRCILEALRTFKAETLEKGLYKRSDYLPSIEEAPSISLPIDSIADNLEPIESSQAAPPLAIVALVEIEGAASSDEQRPEDVQEEVSYALKEESRRKLEPEEPCRRLLRAIDQHYKAVASGGKSSGQEIAQTAQAVRLAMQRIESTGATNNKYYSSVGPPIV